MKIKPTPLFVQAYTMAMIMQFASLTRMIELFEGEEPQTAADKRNTIMYSISVYVSDAASSKDAVQKCNDGEIVLTPVGLGFTIHICPKIAVHTDNCPPLAMIYQSWMETINMPDDQVPLSAIFAVKYDDEGRYIILNSGIEKHLAIFKRDGREYDEVEVHPDNVYNISLNSVHKVNSADRLAIFTKSKNFLESLSKAEIELMTNQSFTSMENFFKANRSRGNEMEEVLEFLRKEFGNSELIGDTGDNLVFGVKLDDVDQDQIEKMKATIARFKSMGKNVSSSLAVVSGNSDDDDSSIPPAVREAKRRIAEAFDKGGDDD